jgi:nucleotide-binding universal stress UspA family protein
MAATVVFAYDGSEDAQRAIAVAGELLGAHRAVIVHVRLLPVPQIAGAGEGDEPYTAFEQAQQREADRISAEGVEAAERAGVEAEAVVAAADSIAGVWGAVIDVASEREAAVIVAGRRGISRVQSALMGSVSNGLVNHAPISVLVVPHTKA